MACMEFRNSCSSPLAPARFWNIHENELLLWGNLWGKKSTNTFQSKFLNSPQFEPFPEVVSSWKESLLRISTVGL
jgi:hypothetical protein